MKTKTSYHLSRVQADGWNAARAYAQADLGDNDVATIEAMCPYDSNLEKSRWVAGFQGALNARGANEPARPRKVLHLAVT
jgi:hypothetical protein